MTFGMILLVIVMALSLAGSLIPQQEAAMTYVNAYGSQTAMLLLGLGFTDIFHTWYFYTLEILLCLNLMLCSILRFPKTRKAGERLKRRAQEAALDKPFHYIEEYQKITSYLSAVHFTKAETSNGALVYTKHLMGFYGSFFVHLSILLVLLFGSLVLMTPKVTDQTVMPGEALTLSDGTTITCDSFHIQDETGKLDYASVLTAASPDGKQSKTQEIRVNEPMRFGSYKIYQQTYGTAGRIQITNTENGAVDVQYLTDPCFLSIDQRNGFVLYEWKDPDSSNRLRVEMCYWNESDGKHKIFACGVYYFDGDKYSTGQFDGLTFYRYDNAAKTMTYADDLGFDVEYSTEDGAWVTYDLPRSGKNITVNYWYQNGTKKQKTLQFDGHRFSF